MSKQVKTIRVKPRMHPRPISDYHKGAKHGFQLGVLYTCCIMAVVLILIAVL